MSRISASRARLLPGAATALLLGACAAPDLTAPTAAAPAVAAPSETEVAFSATAAATTAFPELPRQYVNSAWVEPTGRRIRAADAAALQAAIDTALGGDVILLQGGATYVGNFRLRAKPAGTKWITIMTDAPLPAPGTRMTPALAAPLAKLETNFVEPVFMTQNDAHHYRITGVEIRPAATRTTSIPSLVQLGYGDSRQTTTDHLPHDIVLDRVYVHGHPRISFPRCISLNSGAAAVVDSYVSECHSWGQDAQAIQGYNGPGPYKIVNNYLEGSGENVMFGGATILIPNQLPSDIEIRGNHFFKPLAWKGVWLAKNLLELKAAQRVLIENNVFENSWKDGQSGYGLLFKSSGMKSNPWVVTRDVYVHFNVMRNVAWAVNVNDNDSWNQPAGRIRISQNLFDGIGASNGTYAGRGIMLQGKISDVAVVHNTIIPNTSTGTVWLLDGGPGEKGSNLTVTDNLVIKGAYGMQSSGWGEGTEGLDHYFTSWTWKNNLQVGFSGSKYPSTNFAPATTADVGFVDFAGHDYRLLPTSPYARGASDGTDPGVQVESVEARTASAVAAPVTGAGAN